MNVLQITKDRLLEKMVADVAPPSGWKVMIVDHDAMKIISGACKMYDIVENGVTAVEPLEIARQRLPTMDALYFISPKTKSVDLLIQDFNNEDKPQYGAVHLYFTQHVSDELVKKIGACEPLKKRLKALKELYIDFVAYESRVIHFDRPDATVALFGEKSVGRASEMSLIVSKLSAVCATLDEYPIIRYAQYTDAERKRGKLPLAEQLAQSLGDRLKQMGKIDGGPLANAKRDAERATLLILDRSVDPVAPMLHEFTYQAMIYDLLGVPVSGKKHDIYNYKFKTTKGTHSEKEVLLSEDDKVYRQLRHEHIADAINTVIAEMNDFLKHNKAANFDKSKVKTIDDMTAALAAMPEYRETLAKYELHVAIADACMKRFHDGNLSEVAYVEQGLATGEDVDGKSYSHPITKLSPLLADETVSKEIKLRMLMTFVMSESGVQDKTRRKLLETAQLTQTDEQALNNLKYLGVSMTNASFKTKVEKKKKKKSKGGYQDEIPYEISRFRPVLRSIITDLIDGSLSGSEYPSLDGGVKSKATKSSKSKSGTSLRSGSTPKWAKKKSEGSNASAQAYDGARLIVFIAGGVTFSEIRTVYELSAKLKKDIVIVSTHLLTPGVMIDSLVKLGGDNHDADDDNSDDDTDSSEES